MHIMDDIDGVHIQLRYIFQHLVIVFQHLVEIQHLVGDGLNARHHKIALLFVYAAVDGI